MTQSSYVTSGNTTRVYDSSVTTSSELPAGTYRVQFSQMSGYSLERIDTMDSQGERIYGSHLRRLDRIFASYERFDRSLGVMLSGDKGMGKSLMLRLIAERAQNKLGLPAIIVDNNFPGIAQFLDTLGESLIVFDEFEKTFPSSEGAQTQFLGLFDGLSTAKRLYTLTTNSLERTSDFLLNRPGRFHYHIRFDYPDADQVREYLMDNLPEDCREEIDNVVRFTARTQINFDHLRAIAFELSDGSAFKDVIDDLNIKRIRGTSYLLEVRLKDGTVLTEHDGADFFRSEGGSSYWNASSAKRFFNFEMDNGSIVQVGNKLHVPLDEIRVSEPEDAELRDKQRANGLVEVDEIESISFSLHHGTNYTFS